MSKEIINIGIVSKGRLKKESEKIFKKKKLKIYYNKRELLGKIKDRPNIRVLFLHAREIIEQIAIGKLDIGISGFDLLKESEINIQKNIKVEKKLNFGFANLILAVREEFIDVFTTLDLDEVADEFRKKNKRLIRIGSKYPNLTRQYLYSRGVTNFSIVKSRGATESMAAISTAELISDITSSGQTLKANKLRILSDGEILKSQACLMSSKLSKNKKGLKKLIKNLI
jgi:ATP phosphoribosyltransferase|tara:strand:+ start:1252 stop:1932 length:681 start_codon:yes stop_codon:yes gene_type:complete